MTRANRVIRSARLFYFHCNRIVFFSLIFGGRFALIFLLCVPKPGWAGLFFAFHFLTFFIRGRNFNQNRVMVGRLIPFSSRLRIFHRMLRRFCRSTTSPFRPSDLVKDRRNLRRILRAFSKPIPRDNKGYLPILFSKRVRRTTPNFQSCATIGQVIVRRSQRPFIVGKGNRQFRLLLTSVRHVGFASGKVLHAFNSSRRHFHLVTRFHASVPTRVIITLIRI